MHSGGTSIARVWAWAREGGMNTAETERYKKVRRWRPRTDKDTDEAWA